MSRIIRRLSLLLLPLAFAACQPVYDDPYGGYYGGGYSDRIHADALYRDNPTIYRAQREAYRAGVQAGSRDAHQRMRELQAEADLRDIQRARREARLARDLDRRRRAGRDYDRLSLERALAERELDRGEWRDRRPVGSGPYDRADRQRRKAAFDARRARTQQERAGRRLERQQARIEREQQAANAQARIDRLTRVQQRQEARERRERTRSDEDERRGGQAPVLSARDRARLDLLINPRQPRPGGGPSENN